MGPDEFPDVDQRHVPFATLDPADVSPVQLGSLG
jgi:hypothetical protein